MPDEYDFSVGERGKYYQVYQDYHLTPLPGIQSPGYAGRTHLKMVHNQVRYRWMDKGE